MTEINYKETYDKLYEIGYRASDKNCGGKLLLDICKNLDFQSIIDVGCCMGSGSITAANYKKDYTGLEIADIAVEKAQLRKRNVVQGSICNIPFEDNTFDVAFSSETVEHVHPNDIDLALSEMIRVAKKYIVLQVSITPAKSHSRGDSNPASWTERIGLDAKNLHLTIWTSSAWLEYLLKLNVDVIKFETGKKNILAILRKVK